jgi:arylsulfatase A-like enzyme
MSKPNILYIHSHDTGRYVQPYGYAVPTPNIQALAEQGVLFRQAFSAAPTCSPSRAALLTGQCPHASGMRGLAHRGWFLDDYSRHIIHTLAKAGYTSALAGVQHVAGGANSKAADIGYDQVLTTSHDANEALAKAEAFLADPPDKPFFLSVGFDETHRPFPTDDCADDPRYVRPPAPVADTPETRRDMCGFLKLARRLDASIGKVLAALDAAGLTENTLVICTTDHGPAMPGMKCK